MLATVWLILPQSWNCFYHPHIVEETKTQKLRNLPQARQPVTGEPQPRPFYEGKTERPRSPSSS